MKVSRRTFTSSTCLAAVGTVAGSLPAAEKPGILNYNPGMGYRRLGKTNLMISEIVLGGHFNNPTGRHFWGAFANDELPAEVVKNRTEVVSRCIDSGINFLDITYGGEALAYGAALRGRRDKMIVAADDGEYCLRHEQHRNAASQMKSIESCLRRLGTDYLDVWRPQFKHMGGHPDAHLEMCIELFEKIRKQGKARFLGMSTHDRVWATEVIGRFPQYAIVYMPYTLKSKVPQTNPAAIARDQLYEPGNQHWWLRDRRQGLFVSAKEHDVGVITIKPFSAGLIFSRARPKFGELRQGNSQDDELARLTLAYILSNGDLSGVAVGMTLCSEVDNNVQACRTRRAGLDRHGRRKLEVAAERMWARLPNEYDWLRDWELV